MSKLLTILMILPFFGFGQWTEFYHNNQMRFISNAEQTTDGGYIVSGVTKAPGSTSGGNDYDMIIMKTDINGDSLWSKVFGGYEEDVVNKVIQTSDGGYIIGGVSIEWTGSYDLLIIKTNDVGDITWIRQINYGEEGFGSIQQTTDGGYIISSNTRNPVWNNYSDLTLTKLGVNGNIISSTINGEAGNPDRKLLKITDLLGRETKRTNQPLFFIYDDGTVEKRIVIE